MQKKVYFKNQKNQRLTGALHLPRGQGPFPVVIICHGLSSNKDSNYRINLANGLNKLKISALRFDLSGHGQSQGKFEDVTVGQGIKDIQAAIKFVKSQKNLSKHQIGFWGTSLSGGQMPFVVTKDKAIKVGVVFSPAIDIPSARAKRWPKSVFLEWKRTGFIHYKRDLFLKYTFHLDCKKYIGYNLAPKIRIPVLVMQGDKDGTIPIAQVKKFFNLLKCEKKMVILKNAGHKITGSGYENKIIQLSLDWFKRYL